MGESADRFTRLANGLSAELDGDLRNIANEFVGYYLLPPMLAAFRVRHPGVIRDGDHQPGQQSEHAGGGSGPVHVIRIWFGKVPYREVLS
jgi:DNA-binding transcriptional LysR family regulator